jgi:hypothetical protein
MFLAKRIVATAKKQRNNEIDDKKEGRCFKKITRKGTLQQ